MHAVDLSSINFPPSSPPNVHFSLSSVTNLPPEWSESFDFINQRLLFGALLREQWVEALSEMYRVLKPGGAIQLVELDPFHPVPESPVVSYYRDIHEKGFEAIGLLLDAVNNLQIMLTKTGFVDVTTNTKPTPVGKMWGEIGSHGTSAYKGAMSRMADVFLRVGPVQTVEEYGELVNKLEQDWDEQGTQYHGAIICARKPVI